MTEGRVFITEITGKMAVSKDGQLLGPIKDVVIDTSTGIVKYLILGPSTSVSDTVDDLGRAVITVKKMHLDNDYVIVSR